MSTDKTLLPDLLWLYRLKQSGLFEPDTLLGALLEPSPLHDPYNCPGCRQRPCEWLDRAIERATKHHNELEYPHS